ncbi:MAG TPA: hypothetical protein VMD75_16245 [Candidatus Binataceae bacterium]|nr:hypothetical protein [Candidatus Binataceae bacterium]
MKRARTNLFAAAGVIIFALTIAGCTHPLIAPPGETAVLIFPDRKSVTKVEQMIKEEGMLGAFAAAGEADKARPIVAGTRVKVLSRDEYSVEVVVARGPYKGLHGFVMKEAVE